MKASCETALVRQPSDKRVAARHLARLAHTVIKQIGRNPDRNGRTTPTVNRELGSDSLGHSPMGPYIGRGEEVRLARIRLRQRQSGRTPLDGSG